MEDFTRHVKILEFQIKQLRCIFFRFVVSSQTNSRPTTDIRDFWSILTRIIIPRHETETVIRFPAREDNSVADR